jgi:hypothetical protein
VRSRADTVAAGIAHLAAEAPKPLRPVIRGMLLTGRDPLYLVAHLIVGRGWLAQIVDKPPWPLMRRWSRRNSRPTSTILNAQGCSRRPASSVLEPRDTKRIHRSVAGGAFEQADAIGCLGSAPPDAPRMG